MSIGWIRKMLALSAMEKRTLLRAVAVLAWVRWTVATRGLAEVNARIARLTARTQRQRGPRGVPCGDADVTRLLLAAQRALPWRSTCLHLAAALRLLLAERGIASELRFGVRLEDGTFTAHAWLECAGRVLVGGADVHESYSALVFPAETERV